ncbi:hypothetical protein QCE49_19070 [Caballeronia sp. LZ008]|uniref:hypothetical protein n=1 Tax=unclassified Caballeronia TaxID=2646786 RepID=UPI002027893F|nr:MULTISPECIES: hypothetical protein [unclassified Caballeronia]MDR5795480.1 hypothetical protein [Caballeronia sp. LZ008]
MSIRYAAALLAALFFHGCTLVYIEGDHNAVSDTGGHGGVRLPEHESGGAASINRLIHPQQR